MQAKVTFSHRRKKRRFSFESIVSGLLHPMQITYSSEREEIAINLFIDQLLSIEKIYWLKQHKLELQKCQPNHFKCFPKKPKYWQLRGQYLLTHSAPSTFSKTSWEGRSILFLIAGYMKHQKQILYCVIFFTHCSPCAYQLNKRVTATLSSFNKLFIQNI